MTMSQSAKYTYESEDPTTGVKIIIIGDTLAELEESLVELENNELASQEG